MGEVRQTYDPVYPMVEGVASAFRLVWGVAIWADEEGLFYQDQEGPCMSWGFPGRVEIDYSEDNPDKDYAYWNYLATAENEAKWRKENPEKAAEQDAEFERWMSADPS